MRWSVQGQTPEYLAATRMISLSDPIIRAILSRVPIEGGYEVLDVGSGSGEFSFRLGSHVRGARFTGIEFDESFVEFATRRASGLVGYPFEQPSSQNSYKYVVGDAAFMPFHDDTFDAVVSHTFLTAAPNWQAALSEMKRVCKPGGMVASITSMTDDFYGTGFVSLFTGQLEEDDLQLLARVDETLESEFGSMYLTPGIAPRAVPLAFAECGLKGVQCLPLGQYFCLSDAALSEGEYLRHVKLLEAVERERLSRFERFASHADCRAFDSLIERRTTELISKCGKNREWDWYGNTSLLVCGKA